MMLYYYARRKAAALALCCLPAALAADAPRVVTDIAPVHALVSQVMDGVGTPELLLQPGGSAHGMSLRPSQARAIAQADVVVAIGPELMPWLADTVESIAPDAVQLDLLSLPGVTTLQVRQSVVFDMRDAAQGHDDHGEAEHDEHDEHDHSKAAHADHGHDDDTHAHDHNGTDAHAWLDPDNARLWVSAIAQELSDQDPKNAVTYAANARAAQEDLAALDAQLAASLVPVKDAAFVVFHDAYQYFETHYALAGAGALRLSDAVSPGARSLSLLKDRVSEGDIKCVFSEPQFDAQMVSVVAGEVGLRVEELDPLGAHLEPGAGMYSALLRDLTARLSGCLSDGS